MDFGGKTAGSAALIRVSFMQGRRLATSTHPTDVCRREHRTSLFHSCSVPYPPKLAVTSQAVGQLTPQGFTHFIPCGIRRGLYSHPTKVLMSWLFIYEVYVAWRPVWQLPVGINLFYLLQLLVRISDIFCDNTRVESSSWLVSAHFITDH